MKRIIKFITVLIILYIVCIISNLTKAMSRTPSSFVEETTIGGIIPINDEYVKVNQATFDLNFNGNHGINVEDHIEKSAYLRMTYDLSYTGSNSSVRFSLPLLNKINYLDKGVQVLVDRVEIEPKLNISPHYNFYSYGSFTQMLEQDFFTDYRENMLVNYEFTHDVMGYQYTVKAPKTCDINSLVDTKLSFINVPIDTIFFDANNFNKDGNIITSEWYAIKSEEEFIFFSSSDILVVEESFEIEQYKDILINSGLKLDNARITKTEMKLSEYLDDNSFESQRFLDTQKRIFYYNIDRLWNDSVKYQVFYSTNILNDITPKYYEMSLEFDVDFYKPQMQVEIKLPIPIHCYQKEMTLEVVPNPAQKMSEFSYLNVQIHIGEKLLSSPEPNSQDSSTYQWLIDGDITLKMVYANSSYKNPYGIIFTSVFFSILIIIVLAIILFFIVLYSTITIIRFIFKKKSR